MKRHRAFFWSWLVGNIVSVPVVLYASLHYWQAVVREEYRTGVGTGSDGDTMMIPAMGFTFTWVLLLVAINLVLLAISFAQRRRRRAERIAISE